MPSKSFGTMRRKPFQRFAALVLLFVLVAAEALTTVHSLDLDAHAGGDACKICISVAGLDTGVPATVTLVDLPRAQTPVGVALDRLSPLLRAGRASARGPPLAS